MGEESVNAQSPKGIRYEVVFYYYFEILTQGYVFICFRKVRGEKQREREKHQCERETSISCLPEAPRPGIKPSTQVCALTKDQTCNLLVYERTPQPTESHPARVRWSFWNLPNKTSLSVWLIPSCICPKCPECFSFPRRLTVCFVPIAPAVGTGACTRGGKRITGWRWEWLKHRCPGPSPRF